MGFAEEMVKKSLETMKNSNPASAYMGSIISADPLEIKIDAGPLLLTSEFLITFKEFAPEENARVALLRVQGKANIFIVLGVINNDLTR